MSEGSAQGQAVVQLAHLAEIDHAQSFGALDGAFGGLNFAAKKTQKGSLAAAVGADETDFHAGGEDKVQACKKQPLGFPRLLA